MRQEDIELMQTEAEELVESCDVHEYEGFADFAVKEMLVDFAIKQILKNERRWQLYLLACGFVGFLLGITAIAVMFKIRLANTAP